MAAKPGPWRSGPVCPKAVMRAMMSEGRSARRSSQPSPHDSSTPGRKFSITTSHSGTRRRTISCPWGVCRSRVITFLPRLSWANQ